MNRLRVACPAAVSVFVVLFGAGCSHDGRRAPSVASEAAYRTAVTSFLTCMRDYGYRVSGPVVSPLDRRTLLRDVVTPSDGRPAEYNARLTGCEERAELPVVEPAYLATHPPSLHPALLGDAAECLQRQGVRSRGGEVAYGDFVRQAPVPSDFGQCLTSAMRREFPGLPDRITVFY